MYEKEADEIINLVFDSPRVHSERRKAVANWLREFIAGREYGCTGLTADPDGPGLAERAPVSPTMAATGFPTLAATEDLESRPPGFLESVRDWHPATAPAGTKVCLSCSAEAGHEVRHASGLGTCPNADWWDME